MAATEDERAAVERQIRQRTHPVAVLLQAVASGVEPTEADFDHAVSFARPGREEPLAEHLAEVIPRIQSLYRQGSRQPARTMVREVSWNLVPVLVPRDAPRHAVFGDEGRDPRQLARGVKR